MARTAIAKRRTAGAVLTASLLGGGLGTPTALAAPARPADTSAHAPAHILVHAPGHEDTAPLPEALRATRIGPAAAWTRPVKRSYRVSQRYGVRGNWAAGHHTGIDLAVPRGTPVRSVGSGTVVFAGRSGAYGKAITIRMRDRKYTLFAHLSTIAVKRGKRVRAGTFIGRSGNTGRTTGPHLHFEVRAKRGYGSDINPVRYLARHGVRLL
ncbi:M23 family metallopeptidase [Streptomyces boncukensis]|uniref:M23 family metallopeptidase n=1 Tax=Streptomyces boncukensis TaxID=2711219 RepID=A0A6G4X4B6_9ACTN|nr:M23 family metallopeptidase [Streptomyces boncukensis]NGO71720.1 M23 family metallopeptidase [Streptomyces boncukensis]